MFGITSLFFLHSLLSLLLSDCHSFCDYLLNQCLSVPLSPTSSSLISCHLFHFNSKLFFLLFSYFCLSLTSFFPVSILFILLPSMYFFASITRHVSYHASFSSISPSIIFASQCIHPFTQISSFSLLSCLSALSSSLSLRSVSLLGPPHFFLFVSSILLH